MNDQTQRPPDPRDPKPIGMDRWPAQAVPVLIKPPALTDRSQTPAEKPRWWASKFSLPNGGPSYSEMWGTESEVLAIAEKRGFDTPKKKARVKKEMRPSKLLDLPGGLANPAVFHTLCYIGFLAAKSGVVTAEELVQDGSALHELAHFLCCGGNIRGGTQEQVVLAAIRDLERRIPGIPPDDMEIVRE